MARLSSGEPSYANSSSLRLSFWLPPSSSWLPSFWSAFFLVAFFLVAFFLRFGLAASLRRSVCQ